jgi:SapC
MAKRVLLNNVDHHDLRVITRASADFGDNVNQVRIFPTEFEDAQREYPIFFRRSEEEGFHAVALLGLDRDENLFLDETGWQARYVPAIQRRGPFLIGLRREAGAERADAEPMIEIDLDDPRVSRSEGEPVFLPHGGNSLYLDQVAEVLRIIYQGLELAGTMFAAFEAAGLVRAVEVDIRLSDTESYKLPGLFAIDEAVLAGLDGAALERLHQGGFLRAAFMAAASLGNVGRLIDLKNRRRGNV